MGESSGSNLFLQLALGLVLPGAMVVLAVTLTRSCSQGRGVIQAYLAGLDRGGVVEPGVGGAEAPRLTTLLRGGKVLSVGNFQSQHGTSCFWTTVPGATGSMDVRFVLGDDDSRVTAVSAERECECPEDPAEPCRLR